MDFGWGDLVSVGTGGILGGGGKVGQAAGLLSGYGPVNALLGGGGGIPNNYDAKGELVKSEEMAGGVYNRALADYSGMSPAPTGRIQTPINLNVPGKIEAQTIATPGTLAGAEAEKLRAQRITQAQEAAASPSSATAQFKAGMGQVASSALGQAAMARGADRASARRDAMLLTTQGGMSAANEAAATAAREKLAKDQALTAALSGVQASDVNAAQAQTQIGAANQGSNLAAQTTTAANTLNTGQFNVKANLESQEASAKNALDAWTSEQAAKNATLGTGLQAVGAQNQAQGVASGYATGQNQAATQNKGALLGAAGGIIGGLISDERAKTDVETSPFGAKQDFLAWEPEPPPKQEQNGGLLGSILSDEDAKDYTKRQTTSDKTTSYLRDVFQLDRQDSDGQPTIRNVTDALLDNETPLWSGGRVEPGDEILSDERAKREVDRMGTGELIDWAEEVPTATFRYKDGVPGTDGGEDYHFGTLAHALQRTGPLGELMVHERPDGLDEVDYGPLALAVGKAALAKADMALAAARRGGR